MRTVTVLSARERHLIRHALGFGPGVRTAYRNYFNTDTAGLDFEDWQELAARGLAIRWIAVGTSGFCFGASEAAARASVKRGEGFDSNVLRHFKRIGRKLEKAKELAL